MDTLSADGPPIGFVEPSELEPDDEPQVRCAACDEFLLQNGGDWNTLTEGFAHVTMICDECFERARARNARQPLLADSGPEQDPKWATIDLPEPDDAFDTKLLSDVRTYGWHCIHVADENHPEHAAENAAREPHPIYDASFSYTVGLWLTHSHPELVLVGRWKQNHGIIAAAVAAIEEGTRFEVGATSDQVLERYDVRFGAVTPAHREELLTYASWANRRRSFDPLQLVLPDAAEGGHG